MVKIFENKMLKENKKFRMRESKSGSSFIELKEPYRTNNDFTVKELCDFINKSYPNLE